MELLSILSSTWIWNNLYVVTLFTGHLSKIEEVFGNQIFTAFQIYVEVNIHQMALEKSSPFSSYATLSYGSSLPTALLWCFDIE